MWQKNLFEIRSALKQIVDRHCENDGFINLEDFNFDYLIDMIKFFF